MFPLNQYLSSLYKKTMVSQLWSQNLDHFQQNQSSTNSDIVKKLKPGFVKTRSDVSLMGLDECSFLQLQNFLEQLVNFRIFFSTHMSK
jgi:hypothetical protein